MSLLVSKTKIIIALSVGFFFCAFFVFAQPSFEIAPSSGPTILNTGVLPASGSAGTIFTITADVSDISGVGSVIAHIQNPDEANIALVTLFDDGAHSDGAAGDGTYGNTWDSTAKPVATYQIDIVANDTLGYFSEDENGASFDIVAVGVCPDGTCTPASGEDESTCPADCCDGTANDYDGDGCITTADSDCGGTETVCDDTIDNNCDGLVDCADPDCFGNPACVGPLTASIASPNNNDEFKENTDVDFTSSVSGGTPPYTYLWQYQEIPNPPANMGNTPSVTQSFSITMMGFATYQITLQVTDSIGAVATDSIMIHILKPLQSATIFSPADGSVFEQLETISFTGFANGGKSPFSYAWTSNIDGNIGSSGSFDNLGLSAGIHTIALDITDGFGDTATDSITVTITVPPSVKTVITSPEDKKAFAIGDLITFDSLAAGGTAPYAYSWVSNIDGNIGNSQTFNKNDLSVGDHTITLTVTDVAAATDTVSIDTYIVPDSFDWRDVNAQNWMTNVKNQGACGSCWAFATVGSMEAKYNIEQNNSALNIDLSEQYLVSDCCSTGNCFGGMGDGFWWMSGAGGIPDENCYGYLAANSACPAACDDASPISLGDISNRDLICLDKAGIQNALIQNGPLYIEINAGFAISGNLDNDGCSIYTCAAALPNHAVVLVGYDNASQYWIIKNSWGALANPCFDGYESLDYGTCYLPLLCGHYGTWAEGISSP